MESTAKHVKAELSIQQVECEVRLGCSNTERSMAQRVAYEIGIQFAEVPPACRTDMLGHTICYGQITEKTIEISQSKEFQLIEHLCHEVFSGLGSLLPAGALLRVHVKKIAPPVGQIHGGAHFTLSEF